MPYGVEKDLGGDNKKNDKWMENCVQKVMKSGKDKGSAVAICKSTMQKMKNNKTKANFLINEVHHISMFDNI
jgi:hypothetical protein